MVCGGGADKAEMGTVEQDRVDGIARRPRVEEFIFVQPRDRDPVKEMQLPWTAVVVKAVGDIGILLEFQEHDARAYRVNRSSRHIKEIARHDRMPVQQILDRTIKRRLLERFSCCPFLQT